MIIQRKRYLSSPSKYYATDLGLRNVRLNFRQHERSASSSAPDPVARCGATFPHPAPPCKAAQSPPPPAMKRLAILLPLLALATP